MTRAVPPLTAAAKSISRHQPATVGTIRYVTQRRLIKPLMMCLYDKTLRDKYATGAFQRRNATSRIKTAMSIINCYRCYWQTGSKSRTRQDSVVYSKIFYKNFLARGSTGHACMKLMATYQAWLCVLILKIFFWFWTQFVISKKSFIHVSTETRKTQNWQEDRMSTLSLTPWPVLR